MIRQLRYLVVAMVLVSLGGCFIPVGGGGYHRGGRDDDDSYQTSTTIPHVVKVDWPQVYRGYAGPSYWNRPEQPNYVYRNNDRREYYQQRRDEDHHDEERRHREDDDN
jgi:hypothetical protein